MKIEGNTIPTTKSIRHLQPINENSALQSTHEIPSDQGAWTKRRLQLNNINSVLLYGLDKPIVICQRRWERTYEDEVARGSEKYQYLPHGVLRRHQYPSKWLSFTEGDGDFMSCGRMVVMKIRM